MAVDVIAVAVAVVAVAVSGGGSGNPATDLVWTAAFGAMAVASLWINQLYLARVCAVQTEEIRRVFRAMGLVAAGGWIGAMTLHPAPHPWAPVVAAGLAFFAVTLARGGFRTWLRAARSQGRFLREVLLVGEGPEVGRLSELIEDHPDLGLTVVGIVGPRPNDPRVRALWSGPYAKLPRIVDEHGVTGVILAGVPDLHRDGQEQLRDDLNTLSADGLHVQMSVPLAGIDHRRLRFQPLAWEPLLYIEPPRSPLTYLLKRPVDVAVATGLLVLTGPVLVAAMVAILITDGRPVLFRQTRIGRNGRPFTLLKLRTMTRDAEARRHEVANEYAGPLFKTSRDPRVTRLGRFLRAASIDEIPQLLNVIRGDMSMVGPRPALPAEVAEFDERLRARHTVRPGVTGLWQVEARDNPSFNAYQRLDLHYVRNWSLGLDLAIMLATGYEIIGRAVVSLFPSTSAAVRS